MTTMATDEFNWGLAMAKLTQSTLEQFCQSDLDSDLSLIPGVGPKSIEKLNAHGIKNAFNFVGKFLMLFDDDEDTQENCNNFYLWLCEMGISSEFRHAITRIVVEKVYVMIPGMIDLTGF